MSLNLYHKEWQFSCHLTKGRNIKDLSVENLLPHKIRVSFYHKEWQFSCHHISGRNDKDLSLKNVSLQIVYCTKIKFNVSLYHKGRQFSCHLITSSYVKDLFYHRLFIAQK